MSEIDYFRRSRLGSMEKTLTEQLWGLLIAGTRAHKEEGLNPLEAFQSASREVAAMVQRALVEAGHSNPAAVEATDWLRRHPPENGPYRTRRVGGVRIEGEGDGPEA